MLKFSVIKNYEQLKVFSILFLENISIEYALFSLVLEKSLHRRSKTLPGPAKSTDLKVISLPGWIEFHIYIFFSEIPSTNVRQNADSDSPVDGPHIYYLYTRIINSDRKKTKKQQRSNRIPWEYSSANKTESLWRRKMGACIMDMDHTVWHF